MINNKKICFISCVNDEVLYDECLRYIQCLNVPEGYTIDSISVKEANSMSEGYNEAMKSSDAKYKVYLHQDVFIINKNFINDILDVFNSNEKIGMLGVCGAETIPPNAVWWDSMHRYGKVYENHTDRMEILAFNEVDDKYHNVKALDGLIMVTQYDLPWRDDIFDGWHFYDISQCTEFALAGYKIVVPKQNTPWCIHDCGLVETKNGFEKYKSVFLDEYSKKIFPLVSIMITAYNRPEYFKIALESAIKQTYKNIEIVICDNSTNDECAKVIKPYLELYSNIKYYRNEKELEVIDNFNKCIKLADGEYICFLMDDDIYHENKIINMAHYLIEFNDVSLVTSYRQLIDADGNMLNPLAATTRLFDRIQKVDGKAAQEFILDNMLNVIGETTTPLFRKKDIAENNFGVLFGKQYKVISDLVTWIALLSKGNLVYIPDTLSYFRLHSGQDQQKISTILRGANEWLYLINNFLENNLISKDGNYKKILKTWVDRHLHILNKLENKQMFYDVKLKDEFLSNYKFARSLVEKVGKMNEIKVEALREDRNYDSNKKICFIYYVDKEITHNKCLEYIKNLKVPTGYIIEIRVIRNVKNISQAYNKAMKSSNAKFKVYLEQGNIVANKNFIYDILEIFNQNKSIGMIGAIGSKTIPTSGDLHDSINIYGGIYYKKPSEIEHIRYKDIPGKFTEVKILDGSIMATQYDIEWREDLFDGKLFYDYSQSVEFMLKGYKIVAANIGKIILDKTDCNEEDIQYDKYQEVFLKAYSCDIFPLVTIMIMTHNRLNYFKVAFESALGQTYKNIEIVVCDDSDDEETKKYVAQYLKKYSNIKYCYEKGVTGEKNQSNGLKISAGEYLNILMDDDALHVDKIKRMMNYFIEYDDITIVTSHRQVIDKYGNYMPDISATKKLFNTDTIIEGNVLGNFVLSNLVNCIGEPSTVLTKRNHIVQEEYYFGKNHKYIPNNDIARNLRALAKGKCAYISDSMSYFRIHDGQDQDNHEMKRWAIMDWFYLIRCSYENNLFFYDVDNYKASLIKWINLAISYIGFFNKKEANYNGELMECINYAINFIITS